MPDSARGPEPERHRTTVSVLPILASLGLIAGLFVFGVITRPLGRPATQFDSNSAYTSDAWRLVKTIPATVPYAIVARDGHVLVFTSSADPDGVIAPSGLEVWRSFDGLAWEPLGTVIEPGFLVDSISSTSLGLVALGLDESQETPRMWLSADGLEWLPLLDGLPVESIELRTAADTAPTSDLDRAIGSDARVVQYEPTEKREIALVSREPDFTHPYAVETFEIWTTTPR